MHLIASLVFCISLTSVILVSGWKNSDTEEYNEDSRPVVTSPWMEANVDKRNTWWTKKSATDDQKPKGCHMGACLLMFKECLRRAENLSMFAQCKESQFACMAQCLRENREKLLMNASSMSS